MVVQVLAWMVWSAQVITGSGIIVTTPPVRSGRTVCRTITFLPVIPRCWPPSWGRFWRIYPVGCHRPPMRHCLLTARQGPVPFIRPCFSRVWMSTARVSLGEAFCTRCLSIATVIFVKTAMAMHGLMITVPIRLSSCFLTLMPGKAWFSVIPLSMVVSPGPRREHCSRCRHWRRFGMPENSWRCWIM